MTGKPLGIAVVGGGVAGITAAHLLSQRHRVTLYERNDYLGGHTNTIVIPDGPDAGTPVDTGFIVLNDRTYPLLHRLLARLGVAVRYADMSFGYHCRRTGLAYSGKSVDSLFAQRRNLLRPSFWRMLAEIRRFGAEAARDLAAGGFDGRSLGRYLESGRYGREFVAHYILPMGAAIWSTPGAELLEFPAQTFARFFANHGLLSLRERPRWQTVVGGSHAYVKAFRAAFRGEPRVGAPVASVRRTEQGAVVRLADGSRRSFDRVFLAAHADESLALLEDPSPEERRLLGAWRYARNETVLHTDASILPPLRRAWASWNCLREPGAHGGGGRGDRLAVTYDMNNLQGLRTQEQYCVTLNREIDKSRIIRRFVYTHPMYTFDSVRSQEGLPSLNGKRFTYFCGSYFGYGFHEDAVRSAVSAAGELGGTL